jgi:hypothetical protein
MSDNPARIPVAWADEDGEDWWAEGHWSDEAMLIAVLFEQIAVAGVGPDDLLSLLVGTSEPWDAGDEKHWARQLSDRLSSVTRLWMAPDPDNNERWHRCDEDDPGARAHTRFTL